MKLYLPFFALCPVLMRSALSEELQKDCFDDMDYVFTTEFVGEKDCAWLSEKESREMKYCETRGWDNLAEKKVKFACRKTCANFLDGEMFKSCEEFKDATNDEEVPFMRVGKQCWDSPKFEFETEHVGTRDCAWVAEKEERQMKYCEGKGWDGVAITKVKFGCKESCRRFLRPGYLSVLDDCRVLSEDEEDECTEAAISMLDIAVSRVNDKEDSEVMSSACNPENRERMIKDVDVMKTSPNPCARRFYEMTQNTMNESLASTEACELEVSYELDVLHNIESRRMLSESHVSRFELAFLTAVSAIAAVTKLGVIGAQIGLRESRKGAGVFQFGKRRQLHEGDDLADVFDFIKGEPVATYSEMGIDNTKCDLADYESAVIIAPGPHLLFGARPIDSNDCPIIAFDSHYALETKTMFVLREDQDQDQKMTGNLRTSSGRVQMEGSTHASSEEWSTLSNDPIYPIGNAKLHDIYEAFNATEPLKFTEFHVEKHNCFHFVKDMWRQLGLKEDEGLLDFMVENVVQDDNISRMLSGIGSSGSSRKAVHGDDDALKEYIHNIVSNQLDL